MRFGLLLLTGIACASTAWSSDDLRDTPHFRRPVAACLLDEGRLLAVAHRDSGSVSLLETTTWEVLVERPVGDRLADVTALPDQRRLLAVDSQRHELIVLSAAPHGLDVVQRVPVARHPVSVVVLRDGRSVAVASLWSRRLTLLAPADDGSVADPPLAVRAEVQLPFAPKLQCELPQDRVVVADAFGGGLAIVGTAEPRLLAVRELPGHNIRGLVLSPGGRDLYVAHQQLNQHAPTTYDSVHWGNLMENLIRVVPVAGLADPRQDVISQGRAIRFGSTGGGAADPAGLAFVSPERLMAVSSGMDRAQIFPMLHPIVSPSIPTGRRPTAITVLPQSDRAVVVNTLDDSLTVIDAVRGKVERHVALGPTPEPGPRQRGEALFFDARLSHDGWLSCHSCHTDGHTCGLLADTHGDGSFGTPKRILSLFGTRDNNPWAWNGSLRTLHEQTAQSVFSSMAGELPAAKINDLVAFLHTLPPAPPLRPVPESADDERLLERGRAVFAAQGCSACHVPPLTFTSDQIVDVGLADERGATKFNPPSLRGVGQQERLFHDGRAESLEAVFSEFGHQLEGGLEDEDLRALVRYLQSL